MGKSQAALFVAGMLAGATGSGVLISASRGTDEVSVLTIRAAPQRLADGGTRVEVETCGLVDKKDGSRPSRWCDHRPDPHMDALVAASVDRVAQAQVAGEERQAKSKEQIRVAREREAARAEERKRARDAGQPPAPPLGGPP